MINQEIIQELAEKWLRGTISEAEKRVFQEWYHRQLPGTITWLSADSEEELKARMFDFIIAQIDSEAAAEKQAAFLPEDLNIHTKSAASPLRFLNSAWLRYAALIIFLMGAGVYLWHQNTKPATTVAENKSAPIDILPGTEGAILTLADGTSIVLDSAANGALANQGATTVIKKGDRLVYQNLQGQQELANIPINTLSTPKGRQYSLTLPDGSKVWLNAASSLKYPTVFSQKERKVMITGEAYFEIVPDSKAPFIVSVDDKMEINVLGTEFNVNSYRDEASINTTLVEGSISASIILPSGKQGKAVVLKPRQQARSDQASNEKGNYELTVINNADLDKVTAWKNGFFNFEGLGVEELMRQLSRWYDVEVVYEKGIPNKRFVGEVSRNMKLASLLKILEEVGVRFRVEGRNLIVM